MYGDEKGINVHQKTPMNEACHNRTEISVISCYRAMCDEKFSLKSPMKFNLRQEVVEELYRTGLSPFYRRE